MFARQLEIVVEPGGLPVPVEWLDSFFMRSFTGSAVFDDTLPVADGRLEVGLRVPVDRMQHELEAWCRRKGRLAPGETLRVTMLR